MAVVFVEVTDDGLTDGTPAGRGVSDEFKTVYESEFTSIARVAYLVVRDRPVAEEIAQEAFLRLYDHFDEVRNPAGFLRTAAVRLAITWRNRRRMETERLTLLPGRRVGALHDEPVIDETWDALGRIAPDRAAVLVLRFYEDASYAEIGRIVGASAATVRSRTRRALADLRKELER